MERSSEIIHRKKFVIEHGCHVQDGIIIVLEGQFRCAIGGRSYCAEKGHICVFPKGVLFDREVISPIRCIYLQFDEFPMPLPPGVLQTTDPARTENTVAHLARAVEEENEELTEHFLRDILLLRSPLKSAPAVRDAVVSRCTSFMESGYGGQITLDMLTRLCAISKQALIRKFRESTGKTPMQYLAFLRISQSKRLLRDTDLTVSQIARQCGFENVYYFSNSFLRLAGMRPTQYREKVDL